MSIRPRISVIICTLGREAAVSSCLKSLKVQRALPTEVIIVDAAPSSHHQTWKQEVGTVFPLHIVDSTPGLTHQRNVGIGQAQGDVIAFFDDDTILEPECLSAISHFFSSDSKKNVGAVCGNIIGQQPVFRSPFSQLHARIGNILSRIFFLSRPGDGFFLASGMPTFLLTADQATSVECLYGAAMIFRSNVLQQERCDEHLTLYSYMEDDDIAYRVSRHHQSFFLPEAKLEHRQSPANRLRQRALGTMLIINHHYLFRKNFPQTLSHRTAHILSLIGYPILQLWNLNPRRAVGALYGLWSISFRRDQLSRITF